MTEPFFLKRLEASVQHNITIFERDCPVKRSYDDADLKLILSDRPDVDALIEAILAAGEPRAVAHDPDRQAAWEAFRDLVSDIARRRGE